MNDSRHGHSRRRTAYTLAGIAAACAALAACSAGSKHGPSGSGGAGGSTSASGGGHDDCAVLCATEAQVTCPNTKPAGCSAGCELAKAEVGWCTSSVTPATDCLAKEPASSFQCDMGGQTAPKPGVCTSELAAMQSCWYHGPPGGLPDLSQACSDACAKEASLPCADPSCSTNCVNGVKPGQKCNGALAALVACAAKQDAANFACDTEKPPRANLKQGYCGFEELLLFDCLQQP